MSEIEIPELERGCGSWICTRPDGYRLEFFTRGNAELAASAGWKVQTAGAYLAELNRKIKAKNACLK